MNKDIDNKPAKPLAKVIDIKKLHKPVFKKVAKARKPLWVEKLNGLRITLEWYDSHEQLVSVIVDPNNPFTTFTPDGIMITVQMLQDAITYILQDDPMLAAQYTQFIENAYKYLKEGK